MTVAWTLKCVICDARYAGMDVRYRCDCGGTLDVDHTHDLPDDYLNIVDARRNSNDPINRSGVWRFRELVLPLGPDNIVTKPEGNTNLYESQRLSDWIGVGSVRLKHEGENPTASFKDRGMTAAISVAKALGMTSVACASTGNTSASMASYAAQAGMDGVVFIPAGKIAYGKLSQALAYGAKTIQIDGDFDAAMSLVQEVCAEEGIYLVNSVNPFRIEGQKAIGIELLQDLGWQVPDWIVLPGGNLGNNSALYKGLTELKELGLIDKLPRIAVIQAEGANPLYTAFSDGGDVRSMSANTLATAIQIGNPVSWRKSMRGVKATNGVVTQVSDQQILDAKAQVDRSGIGAEPASCATVAGLKRLVEEGVIGRDETVCGVLTGHVLKDPGIVVDYHRCQLDGIESTYPNQARSADATLESVLAAIRA